ncbi:DUF397 domain-containing protein [Streptomyces sp. NPDC052396]
MTGRALVPAAYARQAAPVRDSKAPSGPVLAFPASS